MLTVCACGVFEIDQDTAQYRKGEKPMCNEWTCQKVREHRNLRRVPFFDEEDNDAVRTAPS